MQPPPSHFDLKCKDNPIAVNRFFLDFQEILGKVLIRAIFEGNRPMTACSNIAQIIGRLSHRPESGTLIAESHIMPVQPLSTRNCLSWPTDLNSASSLPAKRTPNASSMLNIRLMC